MTASTALVSKVRKFLNEKIPNGGSPEDTNFTDAEIEAEILRAESMNHALYILWTLKAGLIQSAGGDIKRIQAGGESIEKYTSADRLALCEKTAEVYRKAWKGEGKTNSFLVFSRKTEDGIW